MKALDRQSRRALLLAVALLLASAALLLLGASVGSTGFTSLMQQGQDAVARQIVWDIRLPRTLGAWLAGALLGLAGAVAQGLFRNPLADPYLLGSASGAALGGALALALFGVVPAGGAPWLARLGMQLGISGMAFVGAAAAVLLTLALARGVQHTLRLLLAGVIVGVVLGAARDLVELASPDILQAMQAFTLGSTSFVGWLACALMAAAWGLCLLLRRRWRARSTASRWARPRPRAWACRSCPCAPGSSRCWRWPRARQWRRRG
jgi:ABC-type Fe3+-siderophore transport system, permease component